MIMRKQKMKKSKVSKEQSTKRQKWWQKPVQEEEKTIVDHSENIRVLVNIIDRCIKAGNNCLSFTSYLEKQGKTQIIKELGEAMARANYKTLIIDCNLVAPTLSKMETIEQIEGVKGFLDFIDVERTNQIVYHEVIPYIRSVGIENLYFIPIKQNVQDDYKKYIRQEEVKNLFHILKDKFEVILVEAPSFQSLSYMQSIVEASDGYFMVLKSGTIAKNKVHIVKEKMNQLTTESIGVIFNKSH